MYEQPSAGRSRGPVLVALAVLFLAIIGGAVGLIAGHNVANSTTTQPTSTLPTTRPVTTPPTTPPTSPPVPGSPTSPTACPQVTQDKAGTTLQLVLYVFTEVDPGLKPSEIWICKDGSDRLYYQGHRGPQGERLVDGSQGNSLYLTDVHYVEAVGYEAKNSTATYLVTTEKVTVTYDGKVEEEKVVETHDATG